MEKKTLEYYLSLPYSLVINEVNDETGHYFSGRVEEFYDVKTVGNTIDQLYHNIYEVLEMAIDDRLEDGEEVPEPVDEKYSGKILVRLPKSLHKKLSEEAARENVSLNQLMVYKLSI